MVLILVFGFSMDVVVVLVVVRIILLVGFVQVVYFLIYTSTKYGDVKISDLNSVGGVKNHWIKSPGYVVEFESFRMISIQYLIYLLVGFLLFWRVF